MPPVPIPRGGRPKSHKYNITPKSFRKLHPVHYRIFDFLKEEIPVTLIQTCRELYLELIPRIYERVEITEKNYEDVIDGATINPKGTRKPPKVNRDPTKWETRGRTGGRNQGDDNGYKWRDRDSLPLPGLKDRALAHTKVLSFTHHQGAIDFVEDSSYCWRFDDCNDQHILAKDTFLNLEHVHLGEDVIEALFQRYAMSVIPRQWNTATHRMPEIFESLWKHSKPNTICFDMPEKRHEAWWCPYEDQDADEWESWIIKQGLGKLFYEFGRTESIEYINLHMDIRHLHLVDLFSLKPTKTGNGVVTFYPRNPENLTTTAVIESLFAHFHREQDRSSHAIKYCLPSLENYDRALDQVETDLCTTIEDKEVFASFKKSLEVNGKPCSCRADTM